MPEHLVVEHGAPVSVIRLDRPEKLNALTLDMLAALGEAVRAVDRDDAVRALIVTGTGRAFSVGADIGLFAAQTPMQVRREWIRLGHFAFESLARCRVPVIAALNGHAFGGGLELAMAADLRVAAEGARLALPEASIGAIPGWGGTQRLPALIGPARARQMVFTAEPIDAALALDWGLVNWVEPADGVTTRADAVAQRVAALSPPAIEVAKAALDGGLGIDTGLALEALGSGATAASEDAREGTSAFAEKRAPVFRGR